ARRRGPRDRARLSALLAHVAQALAQPAIVRRAAETAPIGAHGLVGVAGLAPHVAEHAVSGRAARVEIDRPLRPRERLREARLLRRRAGQALHRRRVARHVLERLTERGLGPGVVALSVEAQARAAQAQRLAAALGLAHAPRAPRQARPLEPEALELL